MFFHCKSRCLFNVDANSHQVVRGYVVFTVDHPAVAVELKVARPMTRMMSVECEHNQVYVYVSCLCHPKATYNIRNSYVLIHLS